MNPPPKRRKNSLIWGPSDDAKTILCARCTLLAGFPQWVRRRAYFDDHSAHDAKALHERWVPQAQRLLAGQAPCDVEPPAHLWTMYFKESGVLLGDARVAYRGQECRGAVPLVRGGADGQRRAAAVDDLVENIA